MLCLCPVSMTVHSAHVCAQLTHAHLKYIQTLFQYEEFLHESKQNFPNFKKIEEHEYENTTAISYTHHYEQVLHSVKTILCYHNIFRSNLTTDRKQLMRAQFAQRDIYTEHRQHSHGRQVNCSSTHLIK